MNKSMLISNLRAMKRQIRDSRETLRVLTGYAQHAFLGIPKPTEISGAEPPHKAYPYSSESRFPIRVVTPSNGHFMTTFFDVDAFSPSGRYLAVTQVPFINRIPIPKDVARICIIDLLTDKCESVYETVGWGAQLGANVQWGKDDDTLFCNNVIGGKATGVRINRLDGACKILGGPIYGLTPDKGYSFSANLNMINGILPGYGVPDPLFGKIRQQESSSKTEGIWKTNLATGHSELMISIHDIVASLTGQAGLAGGKYCIFNVKVSPRSDRLLAVLFSRDVPFRGGTPVQLITMSLDGTNIKIAIPDSVWRLGGHHPNWAPDGENIVMNLRPDGKSMVFAQFAYDGSNLRVIAPGHGGSGHPSIRPQGGYLLTDSYISEGFKRSDNTVPLRLIDLRLNAESHIAHVNTMDLSGPRRIDPHPVWSGDGKKIAFNGVLNGYRQVMIADMSSLD
jgi:hypothetical protein